MAKTVLKIVMTTNGKNKSGKARKNYGSTHRSHGTGGNIGVSAEKRRAMLAFCVKYNIVVPGRIGINIVSLNRVMYAVATNKRALNEFVKISKML